MQTLQAIIKALIDSVKDGVHVCRNLFPLIIPIVIVVKFLQEFGLVEYASMPLVVCLIFGKKRQLFCL